MRSRVEISCDLGEASTDAEQAVEERLWPLVSAASVACGGHAGDEASMRNAARRARKLGVELGAHPSFPDREGFGRRRMEIAPTDLSRSIVNQIELLARIAQEEGVPLRRVKPHGALYNMAHHDASLALVIVEAVAEVDRRLALVAAPGSELLAAARRAGLGSIPEAFADRRYRDDGSLAPRGEEGSLLLDPHEAAAQALLLATEGFAVAGDGTKVPIEFETLCVHGDMTGAVERLISIRAALEDAGIELGARSDSGQSRAFKPSG